jgi:hypothetical protein
MLSVLVNQSSPQKHQPDKKKSGDIGNEDAADSNDRSADDLSHVENKKQKKIKPDEDLQSAVDPMHPLLFQRLFSSLVVYPKNKTSFDNLRYGLQSIQALSQT